MPLIIDYLRLIFALIEALMECQGKGEENFNGPQLSVLSPVPYMWSAHYLNHP